jgi:hypothetical protein
MRILRAIAALVKRAGESPHVRVREIVEETSVAEPVIQATVRKLSPRYIDLVEHLSEGGSSEEPMVLGVTAVAREALGG